MPALNAGGQTDLRGMEAQAQPSLGGASSGAPATDLLPPHLLRIQNKLRCSFCTRSMGRSLFVKCAVCENILLCAECFAAGVRLPPHDSSHSYRVAEPLEGTTIFAKDWTVKEELLLLDGIEKHGMGNWKAIAEAMDTKSAKQVEEHYWEGYMGVHGYCLPATTFLPEPRETLSYAPAEPAGVDDVLSLAKGVAVENVVERVAAVHEHYRAALAHDPIRIAVNLGHERGERVVRDVGKSSKAVGDANARLAALPGADLPGFMPLREDFDAEYENDAEQMLANMEFNPDDHPSEVALKLQVIRIYNRKLQERNERKRFVIDRGLVDFKAQQAKEKKMTKEEREEAAKLRVFARFMSQEDFDELVAGLLCAKRLQQQIDLLKHYKALGMTTLEEAQAYEEQKRKAAHQLKVQKQAGPYLGAPGALAAGAAAKGPTSEEPQKKKRGRPPKNPTDSLSVVMAPLPGAVASALDGSASPESSAAAGNGEKRARKDGVGLGGGLAASGADMMKLAPLADQLTDKELELCTGVPLLPAHYLAIREALVREAHRCGKLTLEGVQRMVKLDDLKREMVLDFFVKEVLAPATK